MKQLSVNINFVNIAGKHNYQNLYNVQYVFKKLKYYFALKLSKYE